MCPAQFPGWLCLKNGLEKCFFFHKSSINRRFSLFATRNASFLLRITRFAARIAKRFVRIAKRFVRTNRFAARIAKRLMRAAKRVMRTKRFAARKENDAFRDENGDGCDREWEIVGEKVGRGD